MNPENPLHVSRKLQSAEGGAARSEPSIAESRTPALPAESQAEDAWIVSLIQRLIAAGGLLLLSPLIALVAVAVRASSPGPVLYRGTRVGRGMREFTIFKFRTLRVGAEGEIGARLLGPRDTFYTSIGRFLKRTKLDELPQLWNVLRGEMNFVGPRPVRPVFLQEFITTIPDYARRFEMKPGITGVAQLRGGYFTTPAAKLRYELWYRRVRRPTLDLGILILTFVKILNRWITLGGLLFGLFVFVSFMPAGLLSDFYIYAFGVRASVAHLAIGGIGAWLVIRRRTAGDRLVLYRTPLMLPMAIFVLFAFASAGFSQYHYQAARGALYYVVTGFLIASGIVNGTFTRVLVQRAVQVIALGALAISLIGIVELAIAVGPHADTMVAGSGSALLVVWRFFPRAVVPCALVLGPFAYLSGGPTLTEWRQELCGPGGALCDLLRHASWTQLLLGIGPRILGEHGFSPEVIDPERASAQLR